MSELNDSAIKIREQQFRAKIQSNQIDTRKMQRIDKEYAELDATLAFLPDKIQHSVMVTTRTHVVVLNITGTNWRVSFYAWANYTHERNHGCHWRRLLHKMFRETRKNHRGKTKRV